MTTNPLPTECCTAKQPRNADVQVFVPVSQASAVAINTEDAFNAKLVKWDNCPYEYKLNRKAI